MTKINEENLHELEGLPREEESAEHRIRVEKAVELRKLGIEPWPDVQPVTAHLLRLLKSLRMTALNARIL